MRLLSTLLIGLGLVACGQSNSPSVNTTAAQPAAAAPAVAKVEIGLVMKTLTNPFFVEMEKGARKAEQELGIRLTVKTAAQETSIEQQMQLIEDLIAAKVSAIVIAPGDSQRLVASLKKAADAGIKIVNIDNRLDPQTITQLGMAPIPYISVNNDAGAYKAGQYLAEGIKSPTEALILEGIRSADNARQRMEGAKRALLENKQIRIVASETANWDIEQAYEVTKALFKKHPNVQLVFASNDMMALGAVKHLQEAGKTKVKVVGFDALSEAIAEIKAGHLAATIDQQAAEQGYQGVVMANKLLQGAAVPADTIIDTVLVTASTLK